MSDISKKKNDSENAGPNAWAPGLQSDIPAQLWSKVTLFREENAYINYATARELAELTGLKVLELVALKPERLVVHALLVRVTADLSVPDDPSYKVLGINLRGMVDQLYTTYMVPNMASIVARFEEQKQLAEAFINEQLACCLFDPIVEAVPVEVKVSLLARFFGVSRKSDPKSTSNPAGSGKESAEILAVKRWKQQAAESSDPLQRACLKALAKTVDAIVGRRGRLVNDQALVCRIVTHQVCNRYGATVIDEAIAPIWEKAVKQEGYRLLPAQSKPVIMNVKGASASGKSTIRPQQRKLAEKLDIPWEDFALISPDYWRKYLLDYDSLGENNKYAAMLTGRELEIIDKRLDRYMADKASRGSMSHLLIDRFRFDSFAVDIDRESDSKLLSRFGDRVYLFFMVTHPAETVERAWQRGLTTGRFKAVDDLLFHNVEAFNGMPTLFLSWVNSKDKKIHFEFLDNDVALGDLPLTAAYGWNNSLTILDTSLFAKVDRYRKVNVLAKSPEEIFKSNARLKTEDAGFIRQCAAKVGSIVFADQASAIPYAFVKSGNLVWWDHDYIQTHADADGLLETLSAVGYNSEPCPAFLTDAPDAIDVDEEQRVTVGRWNEP